MHKTNASSHLYNQMCHMLCNAKAEQEKSRSIIASPTPSDTSKCIKISAILAVGVFLHAGKAIKNAANIFKNGFKNAVYSVSQEVWTSIKCLALAAYAVVLPILQLFNLSPRGMVSLLENKLNKMQKKLHALKNEFAKLVRERNGLQERIAAGERQVSPPQGDNRDAAKKELDEIQAKLAAAENAVAEKATHCEALEKGLIAELEAEKVLNRRSLQQRDESKKELDCLQVKLAAVEKAVAEKTVHCEALEKGLIAELEAEKVLSRRSLQQRDESKKELDFLQAKLAAAEKAVAEKTMHYEALEENLKAELEAEKALNRRLSQDIAEKGENVEESSAESSCDEMPLSPPPSRQVAVPPLPPPLPGIKLYDILSTKSPESGSVDPSAFLTEEGKALFSDKAYIKAHFNLLGKSDKFCQIYKTISRLEELCKGLIRQSNRPIEEPDEEGSSSSSTALPALVKWQTIRNYKRVAGGAQLDVAHELHRMSKSLRRALKYLCEKMLGVIKERELPAKLPKLENFSATASLFNCSTLLSSKGGPADPLDGAQYFLSKIIPLYQRSLVLLAQEDRRQQKEVGKIVKGSNANNSQLSSSEESVKAQQIESSKSMESFNPNLLLAIRGDRKSQLKSVDLAAEKAKRKAAHKREAQLKGGGDLMDVLQDAMELRRKALKEMDSESDSESDDEIWD